MIKLRTPELPAQRSLQTELRGFSADAPAEAMTFDHLNQDDESFIELEARGCLFDHCSLQNGQFRKAYFKDCVFKDCDLSGAQLQKAVFHQVVFLGTKLQGADFPECIMREVAFQDCIADFTNFSMGKLQHVLFTGCKLSEAILEDCSLSAGFDDCQLTGAVFHHTTLKGIDFTTCHFDRLVAALPDLQRAIFSPEQCPALMAMLGVIVK